MEEALAELRNFLWLDERTRSAVISFSVYNANFNLYAACNFIFSFTPGGVIKPTFTFKVMKFDLYENIKYLEDALSSPEVLFDIATNALVVRLALKELSKYAYIRYTYGRSGPYFASIWNILEIINITPFIFAWLQRLAFVSDQNRVLYERGLFSSIRYAEIGNAAAGYGMAFNFDSISILASTFKLFKYFQLNPDMAILWKVLVHAARDMGFFFFMMGVFMYGFLLFGQEMFGTKLLIFSDTLQSFLTLLKMIFGIVDVYWDMIQTASPGMERIIVIIFFMGYITSIFFILINVFLAILNDAYGGVKGDTEELKEEQRAMREEAKAQRAALGIEDQSSLAEKVVQLRKAARGRLNRFQARLKRLSRRRKAEPLTVMDAVAQGTVLEAERAERAAMLELQAAARVAGAEADDDGVRRRRRL